MGIWNAFQYVGIAIGAAYAGAVLTMHEATGAPGAPLPSSAVDATWHKFAPTAPPPMSNGRPMSVGHTDAVCGPSSCIEPLRAAYTIEGCTQPARPSHPACCLSCI